MNVKSVVENKEKFEVELTIEVGQEEFEAGLDKAYRKNRGSISVPGFRKGKAPRKVIEGMYGAGVFYEDAIEEIYPQACMQAIEEKGLDSVAPPRVEITDLGKEGFTFKAIVTVRPVITLKQYKGLEADKVLPTVTDAAVDNELKQYVDRATQLEPVDRAAEMGDSMVMDYEGVKDGVPFEGGSAKGYELALDAVVAAEEIVVSDEDVEEEVKKAAANLNVPYERVTEGLDREALKVDLARDRAMAAVAVAAKPNLIAADAEDGEIKLTEVTKDEEKAAEETEAKPKKRTTKAKAKTEETAEDGEEKKPAAKKPRAKKTTAEGEEAPKKTTTRKKKAEEPKGEE